MSQYFGGSEASDFISTPLLFRGWNHPWDQTQTDEETEDDELTGSPRLKEIHGCVLFSLLLQDSEVNRSTMLKKGQSDNQAPAARTLLQKY